MTDKRLVQELAHLYFDIITDYACKVDVITVDLIQRYNRVIADNIDNPNLVKYQNCVIRYAYNNDTDKLLKLAVRILNNL